MQLQQDKYHFDHIDTGFWERSGDDYQSQVIKSPTAEQLVDIMEHVPDQQDPSCTNHQLRATTIVRSRLERRQTGLTKNSIQTSSVAGNVV